MQIFRKQQATEKRSKTSVVAEYHINDPMINFATSKITGRYPEEKRAVNLACKEMAYISEGSGKIVINDKEHALNTGDVVLVDAGEKYYWEGNMTLIISCTPAWTPEQHILIE